MLELDKLGSDEGRDGGPKPGEGANVAHPAAGESDMEGTPSDQLPDQRGRVSSDRPVEGPRDEGNGKT